MNTEEEIYTLIDRMGNLLKSEARTSGSELGLQAVQQDSLYYLSICNRYSDHLIALSGYLGLTKGTVAQTVKVLEKKGLLRKEKDSVDKRVTHLLLTQEGEHYIQATTPPKNFLSTIGSMSSRQKSEFMDQLRKCLSTYQNFNNVNGFGVCQTCAHNIAKKGEFKCGLTQDVLSDTDIQKICVEFEA